jgi:hypothetical protein
MLNTLRRDRRNRRPASFTLEALDDRIVLSAAAAGAVAGVQEHRIEGQLDPGEHQFLGDGDGVGIGIDIDQFDRRVGVGDDLSLDGDPFAPPDVQRQHESE